MFDRLDIPVPATWEQLLATAQRWQGVDVNGDGQPDWPFCYNRLACGSWIRAGGALRQRRGRGPGARQGHERRRHGTTGLSKPGR